MASPSWKIPGFPGKKLRLLGIIRTMPSYRLCNVWDDEKRPHEFYSTMNTFTYFNKFSSVFK